MGLFDKLRGALGLGAEPPQAGDTASAPTAGVILPWKNKTAAEEVAGNCATGNLRETLLGTMKDERGVHAETLMVVIGAIAGYAAAHSLWETMIKPGRLKLTRDIHVIETKDGGTYYFGDPLNALLVGGQGSTLPLFGFVAGAAVEAGVPVAELPDLKEIFGHVSSVVGSPAFGVIRAAEGHRPNVAAREALDLFWPTANAIFSSTENPGPAAGHRLATEHWPVVTSYVAAQFIIMAKAALDPRLSVRYIMEAAISMSKVDPKTVPYERAKKA